MKRHDSFVFILIVLFCFIAGTINAQNQINIKNFGAKGDGKSNDYEAFLAAANYINKKGTGELLLPKGVYLLDVYNVGTSGIKNIQFENVTNLKILGMEAVIDVKGNFHRGINKLHKGFYYSNSTAIVPLSFKNCNNIFISGIEINGNVDKMTRDSNVMETGGRLMVFNSCKTVKLKNLYLHHAQSDGLYISGNSSNFTASNIISANNGRQGMSIIHLINGSFKNCSFINTGFTEGEYGYHAPGAGIDIEPNSNGPGVENVLFDSCTFTNNKGSQIVISSPKYTTNIIIRNSNIDAQKGNSGYQLILAAKKVRLENSYIDCGPGNLCPTWNSQPGSEVIIKNNIIKSASRGILSTDKSPLSHVLIENNTIEYTGNEILLSYFPYIQSNVSFINNKIVIPEQFLKPKGISSLIQNATISSGNKFYSYGKEIKPNVSYTGTKTVND